MEIVFPALRILAALLLVALNGLFVAAEFSLVKVRATQVDRMVADRQTSAGLVKVATDKLDAYLAVCQLGITISSLGLGALGEPAIAALIEPLLEPLGVTGGTLHTIAFIIAFGIISFFHVVFGELAPKTVAIQSAENTSLFVAPFMRFFYYLLLPLTFVFNGTATAFTRLLGYPPASETDDTHSEEEIRTLIGQSTRQGILETDEESRLKGVFNLESTTAREVMVPRPDIIALSEEIALKDLIAIVVAERYTRYPIHESGEPNRVVGAVHVKDVLRAVESGGGVDTAITPRDLAREVLIVPENRSIENILEDFQKQEIQLAIVIDEWGSFEGLITIEDILEEIVGEIRDEFDEETPSVSELPDGSHAIDDRAPINAVNEVLFTHFESADFDTIGGHVLRVEEIDGARVARVVVRDAAPEE